MNLFAMWLSLPQLLFTQESEQTKFMVHVKWIFVAVLLVCLWPQEAMETTLRRMGKVRRPGAEPSEGAAAAAQGPEEVAELPAVDVGETGDVCDEGDEGGEEELPADVDECVEELPAKRRKVAEDVD